MAALGVTGFVELGGKVLGPMIRRITPDVPTITAADIEKEHRAALASLTPEQRRALDRLANAGKVDSKMAEQLARIIADAHTRAPKVEAAPCIVAFGEYIEQNDEASAKHHQPRAGLSLRKGATISRVSALGTTGTISNETPVPRHPRTHV